jgi:hypothetical protein
MFYFAHGDELDSHAEEGTDWTVLALLALGMAVILALSLYLLRTRKTAVVKTTEKKSEHQAKK